MEPETTTALPDTYLADLCEFLVGHGHTKAADELADRMSGEWSE